MNKRQFLSAAAAAAATTALPAAAGKTDRRHDNPVLLTITGQIGRSNRPGFDPVFDQMLGKHKVSFDKAYSLDFATLASLPAVTIQPTLEYDNKIHSLRGPLLADVLAVAGVRDEKLNILIQAIDGYAVVLSLAELRRYRFILATHRDGVALPLGGLGPLWAVYDADRFPEMAAKPVQARFANCPWGVYHLGVQAA